MASGKRGGRDWVLGGRQLAGVFVLLVVMFGVVFTLGYLLGRSQYDAQLHADASSLPAPLRALVKSEAPKAKAARAESGAVEKTSEKSADKEPAPSSADWDFYRSNDAVKSEPLTESPKSVVPNVPSRTSVPAAVKAPAIVDTPRVNTKLVNSPAIPRGSTVLQVAAMARQSDAVALAQALQQKRFPAFVLPPGADRYYRVQVGPYADSKSAALARHKLESQGFKAIARR
jgi:cell division septation protein DedD